MAEWNPEEWLAKQHTKVLLDIKQQIYRVYGGGRRLQATKGTDQEAYEEEYSAYNPLSGYSGGTTFVTMAQVKAELAKRPHVPNKAEAKVIRQQRAKEQRNR